VKRNIFFPGLAQVTGFDALTCHPTFTRAVKQGTAGLSIATPQTQRQVLIGLNGDLWPLNTVCQAKFTCSTDPATNDISNSPAPKRVHLGAYHTPLIKSPQHTPASASPLRHFLASPSHQTQPISVLTRRLANTKESPSYSEGANNARSRYVLHCKISRHKC
jgi:hypothetical protein